MHHQKLLDYAKLFGYSGTESGVCHGFSIMWAKACCLGNLKNFDKRMKILEESDPKELLEEISIIKTKVKNKIPLTEEEQLKIQIRAFFESIVLFLLPTSASEALGHVYQQYESEEINQLLEGEQSEFNRNYHSIDAFNQSELSDFFSSFDQAIDSDSQAPLVIVVENHTVVIQCVGNKKFRLIDTNDLDNKSLYTHRALAKKLFDTFEKSENNTLIIATEIYGKEKKEIPPLNRPKLKKLYSSPSGKNVLHLAANCNDLAVLKDCFTHIDKNELQKTDKDGNSALHYACHHGNIEAVKLLLEQDFDIDKASDFNTPLGFAILSKNSKLVQLLLDRGANINYRDKSSFTPLMNAARYQNAEAARQLLNRNCTIMRSDLNPNSPLRSLVDQMEYKDKIQFLKLALKGYMLEKGNEEKSLFENIKAMFGRSRDEKVAAANALLNSLNAKSTFCYEDHKNALSNGNLHFIYQVFKEVKSTKLIKDRFKEISFTSDLVVQDTPQDLTPKR